MNNTTDNNISFDARILKELAKMASKDPNRMNITSVNIDTDPNGFARLWATDGHCAALYLLGKVDFEVKTRSYDQEAIKKLGVRDTITYCKETETLKDARGPLVLAAIQTRPDIDQVIPSDETTVNPIGFLAIGSNLVSRCFSFLDKVTQNAGIKLIVPKDGLSPMIATSQPANNGTRYQQHGTGTASVVIMPIRL
tara:strand:+ start:613 stop:1200 length:588 start_codon:yes stop_codon:yes gene_type:complete